MSIEDKKNILDQLRPLSQEALRRLEAALDVELTYSSNAIEGNTLTLQETAIVLEKGVTVRGKPLKDHQEAVDHFDALKFARGLVGNPRPLAEADIRDIHRLVVGTTMKDEAGQYSAHPRRIAGSNVVFPNAAKVPALMSELGDWLKTCTATPDSAFEAHLRLVSIHPFSDGNGRTARLLMNLVLMRGGYPPVVIGPEDRPDYLEAIEKAQTAGDHTSYREFMWGRLETMLDRYLEFLDPKAEPKKNLGIDPAP